MALDREAILGAKLRTRSVPVPGYDEPVCVREFTAKEFSAFRSDQKSNIKISDDGTATFVGDDAKVDLLPWVIRCIVDPATGKQVFKQDDPEELEAVRDAVTQNFVMRCFYTIMDLSKPDVGDLDIETAGDGQPASPPA